MKFTDTNVTIVIGGKIPMETPSEQGYVTPVQLKTILGLSVLERTAAEGNPNARAASAKLDLSESFLAYDNLTSGDEIVIGATTLTGIPLPIVPGVNEFQIGIDFAASVASLIAAIASYTDTTAAISPTHRLLVTADATGTAGNSIAVDATLFAGGTWDASNLYGGHAAAIPTDIGQPCLVGGPIFDNRVPFIATSVAPPVWQIAGPFAENASSPESYYKVGSDGESVTIELYELS